MYSLFRKIVSFIRDLYGSTDFIPLHEPRFIGKEKDYVSEVIDNTFVSSVGEKVVKFEQSISKYTGSLYAIAMVNGTSALHLALKLAGVSENDEVITQALTYVATVNAISYNRAIPIFLDVKWQTLSLDPDKVENFLSNNTYFKEENGKVYCYNKMTNRVIKACIPVHVFGHAAEVDKLVEICSKYNIVVVEDAAESLGTLYKGKHTGTFGLLGILSFNGNKIITTGNGGMILTSNKELAERARHLSTQAKLPYKWEYIHDEVGYNYRLSNLQAALGLAQMENLEFFIQRKRWLAQEYKKFFEQFEQIDFIVEPNESRSNYWLNAIVLPNLQIRDKFLSFTNELGVMTRAVWYPAHMLRMFKGLNVEDLKITEKIYQRVVNLPSSVILK